MKLASLKLSLVVASAALVFAGCSKKPSRPDPSITNLGPAGGAGTALPINTAPQNLGDLGANSGLTTRDPFDPLTGLDSTTLEAQTVYFDYDQSAIKASEREKLKLAKDHLDKNPTLRLVLEGHCDWRGTAEYNLGLGDRRANSVKKYLQSIGVAVDRLETISKGSLEAAKNADDSTMSKDRRVKLLLAKPKTPGTPPPLSE